MGIVHISQRDGAVTEVQGEPRQHKTINAKGREGFQEAGLVNVSKASRGPSEI